MKKKYFSITFILALLVMIIMPGNTIAQKADYSAIIGTWEISMEGRDGNVTTTAWEFFLKDDKLCAKIQGGMGGGRRGGGGGGGERPATEVEGVEFDGENLSFEMERGRGERVMVIEYTAKVKDGMMEGEMAMGDRGGREFTGKKKK